jgi:hypothetical protein
VFLISYTLAGLDEMRSEQPAIGALQRALTHPRPSRWTIDDIASLWCQYVAGWGSVLLSSTKTTRVPRLEQPSIGFGRLVRDGDGHEGLVGVLSPVVAGGLALKARSFHVMKDGRTVPSNYSLFHG